MYDWLKNAFAVKQTLPELTESEKLIIDRLCYEVVRRQMAVPGLAFLEMSQPLNYLGSQVMQFFSPFVSAVLDAKGYQIFANFLERRDSIDLLCKRLEFYEQERVKRGGSLSMNDFEELNSLWRQESPPEKKS